MTKNDNDGQFSFFFLEEPTNRHPKENPLKLEDVEEDLLNWQRIYENKLIRRNINSKKHKYSYSFFLIVIHTILKIYEDSMT